MKTWKVTLVKVFHKEATIEVKAQTEQEAIELAEALADHDEDEWTDYQETERFVEQTELI